MYLAAQDGSEPILGQIDAVTFTNDVKTPKLILNAQIPSAQLTHAVSDLFQNNLILLPRQKYLKCASNQKCLQKTLDADLAAIQKQITQLEKSRFAPLFAQNGPQNAREIERLWGNPLSALEILSGRDNCTSLREFDRSNAIPLEMGGAAPIYHQAEILTDTPEIKPTPLPTETPSGPAKPKDPKVAAALEAMRAHPPHMYRGNGDILIHCLEKAGFPGRKGS